MPCCTGTSEYINEYTSADVVHGCEGAEPTPLVWEDGAHDLGALCADASECGRHAATGGHDARVRLWTAARGRLEASALLLGHAAGVTAVRWAGAGARARLLSGSLDRTARLWAPEGACLLLLPAHARFVSCVAVARDLSFAVTGEGGAGAASRQSVSPSVRHSVTAVVLRRLERQVAAHVGPGRAVARRRAGAAVLSVRSLRGWRLAGAD